MGGLCCINAPNRAISAQNVIFCRTTGARVGCPPAGLLVAVQRVAVCAAHQRQRYAGRQDEAVHPVGRQLRGDPQSVHLADCGVGGHVEHGEAVQNCHATPSKWKAPPALLRTGLRRSWRSTCGGHSKALSRHNTPCPRIMPATVQSRRQPPIATCSRSSAAFRCANPSSRRSGPYTRHGCAPSRTQAATMSRSSRATIRISLANRLIRSI